MTLAEPPIHRWTLEEYLSLAESGQLADKKVELIGGRIVDMAPQGDPHAIMVRRLTRELTTAFPRPWIVSIQTTIPLPTGNVPEPDGAILRLEPTPGAPREIPSLVVEVAESSLAYDRGFKASMYAEARVEDYWVINVIDREVEVFRHPSIDPSQPFGWGYRGAEFYRTGRLRPLALPSATIDLDVLLA
jgi:Uma2 family endonuclease